jgi:protein-tyrosine phosphatase
VFCISLRIHIKRWTRWFSSILRLKSKKLRETEDISMENVFSVLFVCTGNICRSPMAEGMLKGMLPPELAPLVTVGSAGTHAYDGLKAERFAVRAAKEYGIDVAAHRSRLSDPGMLDQADLILVMEQAHAIHIRQLIISDLEKIRLLGEFNNSGQSLEVADPYGGSFETYRTCAKTIRRHLTGLIAHLGDRFV